MGARRTLAWVAEAHLAAGGAPMESVRWVAKLSCGHTSVGMNAEKHLPVPGGRTLCEHAEHGISEVFFVELVDDRAQRGPDGKR